MPRFGKGAGAFFRLKYVEIGYTQAKNGKPRKCKRICAKIIAVVKDFVTMLQNQAKQMDRMELFLKQE